MTTRRCRFVFSDKRCDEPGVYDVLVEDCAIRTCDGRLFYQGYPACVEHAAMLRTSKYAFVPDGRNVSRRADVEVWAMAGAAR